MLENNENSIDISNYTDELVMEKYNEILELGSSSTLIAQKCVGVSYGYNYTYQQKELYYFYYECGPTH